MYISSLGLHLTDQCNALCQHCAYHCGPKVKGVMSSDDARRYLHQVAGHCVDFVCISGGEPCLYLYLVADVAGEARALGAANVWVFTNAFWAVEPAAARRNLTYLKEAGMTRLCLSADSFHQAFIPAERVCHAIAAGREVGLEIVLDVRFLGSRQDDSRTNRITRQVLEQLGHLKDVEVWQGEPSCIGRAADRLLPQLPQQSGVPKGRCPGPWAGGTWENPAGVDVDLYGEVTLCPGIGIGNAKERALDIILAEYTPQRHPILDELATGGPAALAEIARRLGYIPRTGYVSECHLCYDVRRFLRPRYAAELAPLICYEEAASDNVA